MPLQIADDFKNVTIFEKGELNIPSNFRDSFENDQIGDGTVARAVAQAFALGEGSMLGQGQGVDGRRKVDSDAVVALLQSNENALNTFRAQVGKLLESEGVQVHGRAFRGIFKKSTEFRAITSPLSWDVALNDLACSATNSFFNDATLAQKVFWGHKDGGTYHVAYINGVHAGLNTFTPGRTELPNISVRCEQHGDNTMPLVAPGSLFRFVASQFGQKAGRVYYGLKNAADGTTESLIIPFGNKFRTLLFKPARAKKRMQGDANSGLTAVIEAMIVLGDVSLLGPLVTAEGTIGTAEEVYKILRGSRQTTRTRARRTSKKGNAYETQSVTRSFTNKAAVELASEWQKSIESRLIGYAGLTQRMKNTGLDVFDGAGDAVRDGTQTTRSEVATDAQGNPVAKYYETRKDTFQRPQFLAVPKEGYEGVAGSAEDPQSLRREYWTCPTFQGEQGGRFKLKMSRTPVQATYEGNVWTKGPKEDGKQPRDEKAKLTTKNRSFFVCQLSGEQNAGSRRSRQRFLIQDVGTREASLAKALDEAVQGKMQFFEDASAPRTFTRTDGGVTTQYIVEDQPALYELYNQDEQTAANELRQRVGVDGSYKALNQNFQIAFQALLGSMLYSIMVVSQGKERANQVVKEMASKWLNDNATGGAGRVHPTLDETIDTPANAMSADGATIPLKWADDGFKAPLRRRRGDTDGEKVDHRNLRRAKNSAIETQVLTPEQARQKYVEGLADMEGKHQAAVKRNWGNSTSTKVMHAGEPGFWTDGQFTATTEATFNPNSFTDNRG